MMERIAHGGGLIAARRQYPDAPEPWLDLSTGINPVPYPVQGMPVQAFTRLPEPEAVTALEAAAARAYGVSDAACVVAAPGTQMLIQLLPLLYPRGDVCVVGPTYGEYEAVWQAAGREVRTVAELPFGPPPALARRDPAIYAAGLRLRDGAPGWVETRRNDAAPAVTVVCNPNNPDGRRHRERDLLAVHGGLVVDEAFADFEGGSLAGALPRRGLLLLRSFGKAYGLPGVRLGFALADPSMAAAIRTLLGPWAVSGPALHIGLAALADAAWRTAAAKRLARDAATMDVVLQSAGCMVLGGTRLFRLVAHPHAAALADRLGAAGILVRRFDGHPHWLRFGVADAGGLARLGAGLGGGRRALRE